VRDPRAHSLNLVGDTLRGLAPGRYSIVASEATNDTAFFAPANAEQGFDVVEGQTTIAAVQYVVASAAMEIKISGVPDGSTATVTVVGSDSVLRTLTSAAVLRRLRPGTYRVTAAAIKQGLDVFSAGGFPRTLALIASAAPTSVDVPYELVSGRLAIDVRGLPPGVAPQIFVTRAERQDSITSDTLLTGLVSGTYYVHPVAVNVAGKLYASVTDYDVVTVPASRAPVSVTVTYHPPVGRLTIRTKGLPPGVGARVQIGAAFYEEFVVKEVITREDIPVGFMPLYALPVDSSIGYWEVRAYRPRQGVLITPDSAVEMTVEFQLTTGLIAFNVHGIPPEVEANVEVGLPRGGGIHRVPRSMVLRSPFGNATIAAQHTQGRKEGFVASQFLYSVNVDTGTTPIPIEVNYTPTGPLNVAIADVRVMQQAYRRSGTVPLVANREALLTVFQHGDTVNMATPKTRVRIYQHGSLVHTMTLPSLVSSVPTSFSLDQVVGTRSIRIPAQFVQPGLGVLVDIDSENAYDEPNETDNFYPRSQTPLAIQVAPVRPMHVTVVPIAQALNGLVGDVTPGAEAFLSQTRRMFPLGELYFAQRATFGVTAPLTADNKDGSWLQAISEVAALQAAEGGLSYYYGVVKTSYTSGIAGLGLISGLTALGWDYFPSAPEIMAHELGHNYGLLHSPCGVKEGVDSLFPYPGTIGFGGYDLARGVAFGSTTPDFMGYCANAWISDYAYQRIFNSLVIGPAPAKAASRRAEAGLLLWGRVRNGQAILEPAFEVNALPTISARLGGHKIEAVTASGRIAYSIAFAGERVDHGRADDGVFAFVMPLSVLRGEQLAALRLTSNGQTITRRAADEAVTDAPLAERLAGDRRSISTRRRSTRGMMLRDARTGEILAFVRGNSAMLQTRATELDVSESDGVRTFTRRITLR
jgi:hypothetical protein